ncbi:MAG: HK97 family phage prohead protease, partial [Paracoccaceae bacterium]
ESDGRVEGYASLFGVADHGGDVVMPGAFAGSLRRRGPRDIRFLFQHDPAQPIGVWHEVAEDVSGLRVEGEILAEVSRGRDAIALMAAGAIDGLSIGYRTVRAAPDPETGGRRLLEVDLWEVSLVTFPLLPTARAALGRTAPLSSEPAREPGIEDALAAALAGA